MPVRTSSGRETYRAAHVIGKMICDKKECQQIAKDVDFEETAEGLSLMPFQNVVCRRENGNEVRAGNAQPVVNEEGPQAGM